VHILMITEGTYPYFFGGVSTWCDTLIGGLPEVDFTLMSLVSTPRLKLRFKLPANVVDFRSVPIWGVREAVEMHPQLRLGEIGRRGRETREAVVADQFAPLFRLFLYELMKGEGDALHLAELVHRMHRFFLSYDFDRTLRSQAVWTSFVGVMREQYPEVAKRQGFPDAEFSLSDITKGMQWLYHVFFPLAGPLPKVDVAHAAMAGLCTLVAACVKLEHGAAYLLTEHGIYLRESYLWEASVSDSLFLKLLRLKFARRVTELSYALADQVSPCCEYNKRWELRLGVPPEKLKTIYYASDSEQFVPKNKPSRDSFPVVVWVGRINPLKDLATLLRAAAIVHRAQPDAQVRLYGSASPEDEPYFDSLRALHSELHLEGVVIFAGYTPTPSTAFNEADVVVLSSISEGFPFSILEAMLCARPVVATAVGGVPEEIGDCGLVVEPRNPEAMAQAILSLIGNPERCKTLGQAARGRASQEFSPLRAREAHLHSYQRLRDLSQRTGPPFVDSAIAGHAVDHVLSMSGVPKVCICSPHGSSRMSVRPPERCHFRRASAIASVLPESPRMTPEDQRITRPNWGSVGIAVWDTNETVALADEIRQLVSRPVDALEVAALIESLGITDEIARRRYGASDTFALGECALSMLRRSTVDD